MKLLSFIFLFAASIQLLIIENVKCQSVNSAPLLYPYSAGLNNNNNYQYGSNTVLNPNSNFLGSQGYPYANNLPYYPNSNNLNNYPNSNGLNNYPQSGSIISPYSNINTPYNPNNPIVPVNNNYGIRYPYINSYPVSSSYLGISNPTNNVNYPSSSILSSQNSVYCEYRPLQGCVSTQPGGGCRNCIDAGSNGITRNCQCSDDTTFGRK
uniref:Uncharacterized protein n=1 Tax=Plectus sambesii TaxID=2011161 RepID=A0A914XKX0_9BILA